MEGPFPETATSRGMTVEIKKENSPRSAPVLISNPNTPVLPVLSAPPISDPTPGPLFLNSLSQLIAVTIV